MSSMIPKSRSPVNLLSRDGEELGGTKQRSMARPMLEIMDEMKSKLRLIDGETKSFYENSYRYLREAKTEAHRLRERNKELRARIVEYERIKGSIPDHHFVINSNEKLLNTEFTNQIMVHLFDEQVSKKMNTLNLLKHQTRVKKEHLKTMEVEATVLELQKEQQTVTSQGGGANMQAVRITENKIEKVMLKQSEAVHIRQTYSAIYNKLKEESTTYLTTLDALKYEIERCTRKLNELRRIYEDALLIRDKTKTELQRHEELFYAHRKRRELEIGSMRRLVEAKREKPVPQKMPMFEQELRKLDVEVIGEEEEEETTSEPQNRLSYYTLLHEKLKNASGLSDLEAIVARIEGQQETYSQLNDIRQQNDHVVKQLKIKQRKLLDELALTRTTYEEKKDMQIAIQTENAKSSDLSRKRLAELQAELGRVQKLESQVRITVEHLHNKLLLVRVASRRERGQSASAMRDLLLSLTTIELLERCIDLYNQLETDLEEYDRNDEEFKMADASNECLRTRDEYRPTIERRLPNYAVRIETTSREPTPSDDTENGDNEVPTREVLKQRAKLTVEHAKRKVLRDRQRRF